MGIMDGTMAKGSDNAADMERIEMLRRKEQDGSISKDERAELMRMEQSITTDNDM